MHIDIRTSPYTVTIHIVYEARIRTREKYSYGQTLIVSVAVSVSLGTHVSPCVRVWNSWYTRLHRGIAQPKGEHSWGSSRRAVQASCYDFQNGEAQWPRSAPDKIVIIIVLAMAGIEERYTREFICVYTYVYIYNTPASWKNVRVRWYRSWVRTSSIGG
jgi:hypothetical protein